MAFAEGYITGLGLALILSVGPVFFTLLHGSFEHGFRSGLAVAAGIFLGDLFCVLLLNGVGVADFLTNPLQQFYIGIAGAAVLIVLGVKYLLRPYTGEGGPLYLRKRHYANFVLRGFLVNFVNPFVFVVWMGIISLAGARYSGSWGVHSYLAGTLLAVFSSDVLKVLFAGHIKPLLQPRWLDWTFRGIGVLLIFFGLRILYAVFFAGGHDGWTLSLLG
ncbi:MAG: LysE family transporter [Bacteroidia bacterium]